MKSIRKVDGLNALKQAKQNLYRIYNASSGDDKTAGVRLKANEFCPVHHEAKFKLNSSGMFFTMGSCFAREVEIALDDLGISITAADQVYPHSWFHPHMIKLLEESGSVDRPVARPRSPINRYSVLSMLYDFERVLEEKHSFSDTVIPLDKVNGVLEVWDPQIKNLQRGDLNFVMAARDVLDKIIQSVTEADVVILTLGMTETWVDEASGAVLPTPPSPLMVKKFPSRFSFFNADYEGVSSSLAEIIRIIGKYCSKNPNIIFTVSPVPMGSTFTQKDVFVANSYSKSTLVSAAQTTARRFKNVDYFPSFEMAQNSARSIWHDDCIHIKSEFVSQIMQSFIESYIE